MDKIIDGNPEISDPVPDPPEGVPPCAVAGDLTPEFPRGSRVEVTGTAQLSTVFAQGNV